MTASGILTLGPTGTNTVLTVGGTSYSAATVQAALASPSTPVFTGNITLPTTVTAPVAGQMGYTTTAVGASQYALLPNTMVNLAQLTSLGVGVWHIFGTMVYQTGDATSTIVQVTTAISTTSLGNDSQFGFVRGLGSGQGGNTVTTYAQQVQRILTLTAATKVYLTGMVSGSYNWSTPTNQSCLQAVRIA